MYERRYHDKVLKQDTKSQKRSFPWKRTLWVVTSLIVCTAIVLFIRAPRFQVRTITVSGTNVADPEDVSQYVLQQLSGTYLRVFPRSSIALAIPDRIAHRIQSRFPRFKNVTVKRQSMNTLAVSVVEYPGVYLWCDSACSFMDETGTVFADAPYFSGNPYVKFFIGTRAPYPFNPMNAEQLQLATMLTARLTAIAINPIEFQFISEHQLVVVYFHNNHRVKIFFDPTRDIESALSTLYTGIRTEPLATSYQRGDTVLEYLDLRFSSKLVYKFQ